MLQSIQEPLGGVPVADVQDCNIVVSKFKLQLRYHVYFQINTQGKGVNPLIFPSYGLISTTTVLLQGWVWH